MSDPIYTDHLGITFTGPSGDGYSNPTRDIRDAWLDLCATAKKAGVTITLPHAEALAAKDAELERVRGGVLGEVRGWLIGRGHRALGDLLIMDFNMITLPPDAADAVEVGGA